MRPEYAHRLLADPSARVAFLRRVAFAAGLWLGAFVGAALT